MKAKALIVNENAGNRMGARDLGIIVQELDKQGIEFQLFKTKYRGHAIELCIDLIQQGFREFIGVGGDGTLNEIVNGIFLQQSVPHNEFTVGMIPVGAGNDWCRSVAVPTEYAKAIQLIKENRTTIQNMAKVYNQGQPDQPVYFANSLGGGFDGFVAHRTNIAKQNGKGSAWTYLYTLFTSLFQFESTRMQIEIDEQVISDDIFSFTAGMGKYNGGGMKQLPHADLINGVLDVAIIRHLPKWKVIQNVNKLYDGTHLQKAEVSYHSGHRVRIESNPPVRIETDGEDFGYTPIEIELIPKALRIYSGLHEK